MYKNRFDYAEQVHHRIQKCCITEPDIQLLCSTLRRPVQKDYGITVCYITNEIHSREMFHVTYRMFTTDYSLTNGSTDTIFYDSMLMTLTPWDKKEPLFQILDMNFDP